MAVHHVEVLILSRQPNVTLNVKKLLECLQGIVGSTPWNAMVFFTLWLQLLGFSDYSASLLMAIFAGGCALGSALGGFLGMHHPGFSAL